MHIDDLKKYSWCIPVQKKIKLIILRGRNNARAVKSATVVIFEDPKRGVASLLNEAHDDKCGF